MHHRRHKKKKKKKKKKVLRIGFALVTTQLLQLGGGLLLAGGLLLLWVCWKMYREMAVSHVHEEAAHEALGNEDLNADGKIAGQRRARRCARR